MTKSINITNRQKHTISIINKEETKIRVYRSFRFDFKIASKMRFHEIAVIQKRRFKFEDSYGNFIT